jgi:hypothetical protein
MAVLSTAVAVPLLRGSLRPRIVAMVVAVLPLVLTAGSTVLQALVLRSRPAISGVVDAALFALVVLIVLVGQPGRARLRVGAVLGAAWALRRVAATIGWLYIARGG